MDSIDDVILKNLLCNEEYAKKVFPYIKDEYFDEGEKKLLFEVFTDYVNKYNSVPIIDAVKIDARNKNKNPQLIQKLDDLLENYVPNEHEESADEKWLLDQTEKFCQDKAIYTAVVESIGILNGESKTKDKGALPTILADALAVSFDKNIGHDYFDETENRWNFYHKKENKFKFDLRYMNLITKDGVSPKTLNIIMGGTNVGKSLIMCHMAASYISNGYDVLYITMEMAEEEIAKRIDANLSNTSLDDINDMPKDVFIRKMDRVKNRVTGRLVIKEYPTASASVTHFRNLLNELHLKKNFRPQIVFVDYLNICASSRIKAGGNANMYLYVKSIAEELRGLAVEYNLAMWSATQLNRAGYGSSDPDLTNTSESFGLPATADFMFVAVTNEELEALGQYMFIQLKNRYHDVTKFKRFIVGVDRSKMMLYDVEEEAQLSAEQNDKDVPPITKKNDDDRKSKFGKLKTE